MYRHIQFWYGAPQLFATPPTVSPLSGDFVDVVHYVTFYPSYIDSNPNVNNTGTQNIAHSDIN